MEKQAIIALWTSGQFTADELVSKTRITHKRLRQCIAEIDGTQPPPTPSLHGELQHAFYQGQDAKDIAEAFHVPLSTVYRYLKKSPHLSSMLSKEQLLAHQLETGCTAKQLANEFNVSMYNLKKIMGDALVTKRGGSRPRYGEEVVAQIHEMLANGISQTAIADELGISQSFVSLNNPDRTTHEKSSGLNDAQWEQLKACRHRYSYRELSRLYNVSKTYIIERLKRESQTVNN